MHPRVKMIFDEHEKWLKVGGDQAIAGVQQANMAAVIDRNLTEYADDVRSDLRQRLTQAAREEGEDALRWLGIILNRAYQLGSVNRHEPDPVREPREPQQPKGPEPVDDGGG